MATMLVVGLGNPGPRYLTTRHNIGFMVVDALAKQLTVNMKKKLLLPVVLGEGVHEGSRVILAKPTTFMNLSGKAVTALMQKYRIAPEHVIVISDDVTLPLGTIRIRTNGSAGGHNGLKSIIGAIGEQFIRVRIGVDAPPPPMPLETYVLTPFGDILPKAQQGVAKAAGLVTEILQNGSANEHTSVA